MRRSGDGRPWVGRIVRLGLACGAFALGVVFVILPGPAVVFFLIAGALLAPESLAIARAMDGLEVLGRRGAERLRWCWSRLSRPGRVAVGGALVLAGAAGGWVSYRLLLD